MLIDEALATGAGMSGGLTRWLLTPDGMRGLLFAMLSGAGFGYCAYAVVGYFFPALPGELRYSSSFIGGILSSILYQFVIIQAKKITIDLDGVIADKLKRHRGKDNITGDGNEPPHVY